MRKLGVVGLALISLLASFALSVEAAPSIGAGETSEQPTVELLEAGSTPRETLRLVPTPGFQSEHTMLMHNKVEQSGAVNATSGPIDVQATIATTVGDVDAEGNVELQFTYTSFELLETSKGPAASLDAARENLAAFDGATGTSTITPTGATLKTSFELPPDADAATKAIITQLGDQADQLAVPFPEEAVGVGARWRVSTHVELNGIDVAQTFTYTLRAREGTRVELSVKGKQTAKKGLIDLPGVPASVDVRITKFLTRLSGTSVHELTDPFPATSTMTGSGTQVMTLDDGKDHARLVQKIELQVDLS